MDDHKVYIFFERQLQNSQLFMNWIKERGFIPVTATIGKGSRFWQKWNQAAQLSDLAICIDYPIDSDFDLKTIDSFIEFLNNKPGQWYYSPRPNDYLRVEKAAFMGMNPVIPLSINKQLKNSLRSFILGILSFLPDSLEKNIKYLGKKFLSRWKMFHTKVPSNSDPEALMEVSKPKLQVPSNLKNWSVNWQPWQPETTVIERDLLDRVEHFFPHPSGLHVILLNKCNLKCVMCPYHSPVYGSAHTSDYFDELKSMSSSTFQKIADYAGKHKIRLQFGQIEEPLLHKQIFDFFKLAKSSGVPSIHLTTNGTLLDREKAEKLSDSGVNSVMFSIDAANPETYKKIRGKDLNRLEKNIKFFMPLAKQKNIKVTVSFILQSQSKNEREQFLEKWRAMGIDRVTFYVLTEHDLKTGASIRTEEHYEKGERYPCASPWIQSVIFPDGDISLCCKTMTDIGWRGVVSVGNLQKQSFEEIWTGRQYKAIRNELLKNVFNEFNVCADCHIWSASSYITEINRNYIRTYNETTDTITFSV